MRPAAEQPDPTALVIHGGQAVSFLDAHLERLRNLPSHGNRKLEYDQLLLGLLLSFFNPIARSLRTIDACGDFNGRLDIARLARSTTSDAMAVFDPVHLGPVIQDLQKRVGSVRGDPTLFGITRRIIAGDGTYLNTLADVAWALKHTKSNGKKQGQVRLNVQLDVASWAPQVVSVSGDDGSEPAAFAKDLLRDVLYVFDRNFLDFAFLQQVLDHGNHFVLRVRDNAPATRVVAERTPTPQDAGAGVVGDQTVTLTGRGAPGGEFRLVVIRTTNRSGKPETIRLLTSLTAPPVSAALVGEIYRLRWQIELFFKWLKTWAGLNHLLSTTRNGITFQFYVAVIAVLLMYVQLGRRVSRYALASLHLLMHGQITFAQMITTLERLEREKDLARKRAAARRAVKKIA